MKSAIERNGAVKPNSDLLEALRAALPQFFDAGGAFRSDKFLEKIKAANIDEARDGYKLGFVWKDYALLQTGRAPETVIVPDCKHNALPENKDSGNIFITGDKFEFNDEKLSSALGYTRQEVARLKSIQGKSSHSAWLTFTYPRLKIAQKLLTPDGVIFVSIDDNEQANQKLLMDDVFWDWNHRKSSQNDTDVSLSHNYTLCYARNRHGFSANSLSVDDNNRGLRSKTKAAKMCRRKNAQRAQPDCVFS